MTVFTKPAEQVFAPQDAAGEPRKVVNHEAQVWGTEVERALFAFKASGGVIFQSLAEANANLDYDFPQEAWVLGDPVAANNGIYQKQGASGSGSWLRLGDLPYSFIRATDTGAGTANAIQATTTVPVPTEDGGALISLSIAADNTADAPTVSFNGGPALTITDAAGTPVGAGGLSAGMLINGYKVGTTFRVDMGPRGWSPLERIVHDGERRVVEVYDWTGGHGAKPTETGYVGPNGLTGDIAQATDIRGPAGPNGPGTGDMLKSMYDPQGVEGDAFDGGNLHDGTVTTGKLADDAVTNAKLADDAVTTDKIADDTVTRPLVAPNIRPTIPFTPLEYGAVMDGATDDTAAVQAAANAAIAANMPLYIPSGSALVGELATVGPLRMIGAPGGTITLAAGAGWLWDFDGGGTGLVQIKDVILDAANVSGLDHISDFASGKLEMIRVEAANYNGTLNEPGARPFTLANTVTRANIHGGEYHHLTCGHVFHVNSDRAFFTDAHLHDLAFHGIRFGACQDGRVIGCLVEDFSQGGDGTLPQDAGGSAVLCETGSNHIIVANNTARRGCQLFKADDSASHIIVGNVGDEPAGLLTSGSGIQLQDTDNCTISNNQLWDYNEGMSVLGTSSRTLITGNWLWNATTFGINISTATATVVGNQINNSGEFGVRLVSTSSNCTVRSNTIRGSGTAAVSDTGTGNTVADNDG